MRMIVYFHHKAVIYNQMLKKYAAECAWQLPKNMEEYSHFTDSHLFDKMRETQKESEWAWRILNQKPYLRFYETRRLNKLSEQERTRYDFIKRELKKESIPFIEIDSENHSIKPQKTNLKDYSIFLKDSLLQTERPLSEEPSRLSIPQRRIERIYVEPQFFKKAKTLLKD